MKAKNSIFLLAALAIIGVGGYGLYRTGMSHGINVAGPASKDATPVAGGQETGQIDPATGKRVLYWHDPMVPGQRFDKPGKSPFMDMQLVPVYADDEGDESKVTISPRMQQSLDVRTAEVTRGAIRAGVFSPARAAPEFSLRGSDGAELRLSRYRGKVTVLAFGYTSCPNVCPTTLAVLGEARKKLGAANEDVQVLFITVDPERDDAERMRKYLTAFDPTFVGGTGTAAQLSSVRQSYGIAAAKQTRSGNYAIAHSSYVYLIDRDGKLRALMPYGQTADDYMHDISILLKQ